MHFHFFFFSKVVQFNAVILQLPVGNEGGLAGLASFSVHILGTLIVKCLKKCTTFKAKGGVPLLILFES